MKPPSEKQTAARNRNFRVLRLRGWKSQCLLTGERRERAVAAIDEELALLGAAPMPTSGKLFKGNL